MVKEARGQTMMSPMAGKAAAGGVLTKGSRMSGLVLLSLVSLTMTPATNRRALSQAHNVPRRISGRRNRVVKLTLLKSEETKKLADDFQGSQPMSVVWQYEHHLGWKNVPDHNYKIWKALQKGKRTVGVKHYYVPDKKVITRAVSIKINSEDKTQET